MSGFQPEGSAPSALGLGEGCEDRVLANHIASWGISGRTNLLAPGVRDWPLPPLLAAERHLSIALFLQERPNHASAVPRDRLLEHHRAAARGPPRIPPVRLAPYRSR